MSENLFEKDEDVRAFALAQSVALAQLGGNESAMAILTRAKKFEQYIKEGY